MTTKANLTFALNDFINAGVAAGIDVEGFDVRWDDDFEAVVYQAPCSGGGIESFDLEHVIALLSK